MKIQKAMYAKCSAGFFFDDQRAIRNGAQHDGFSYIGKPVTSGFNSIRQAGEAVSVILQLENGAMAVGDAAAVQYSGAGGRDPLFLADKYIPFLEKNISPLLEGADIDNFRHIAEQIDNVEIDGKRLHTALRYGISQALLDAAAGAGNKLKMEVICDEYNLPVLAEPVPIFGQSGDDRYAGADKMILKNVDVLPHALINNIDEKLGRTGEKLKEYIKWLAGRIRELRVEANYRPAIHIDVYGTLGMIFDESPDKVAEYLAGIEKDAGEFQLYIEGPVDMDAKLPQIETLKKIKTRLSAMGATTRIVADEWCNTIADVRDFTDAGCCHMVQIKTPDLGSIHNIVESILYCREHNMESYQGGSCNETDISARCCVHIALAARAERMLAKPGMGFDEGFAIVKNEMQRAIAVLKNKKGEQR